MYLIDVACKLKYKYGDNIYISVGDKEITNEDANCYHNNKGEFDEIYNG